MQAKKEILENVGSWTLVDLLLEAFEADNMQEAEVIHDELLSRIETK